MGFHRENHAAGRLRSEGYLALFTVKDRGAHPHKGLPAFPLPGQGVGSVQLSSRRGSFHRENLAAGRVCTWGGLSANLHRDAPMSELFEVGPIRVGNARPSWRRRRFHRENAG